MPTACLLNESVDRVERSESWTLCKNRPRPTADQLRQLKPGAEPTGDEVLGGDNEMSELGNRDPDCVAESVELETKTLDRGARGRNDLGGFGRNAEVGDDLQVLLLERTDVNGVSADEDAVVNVSGVPSAVDEEVGVCCDAIGRLQCCV